MSEAVLLVATKKGFWVARSDEGAVGLGEVEPPAAEAGQLRDL